MYPGEKQPLLLVVVWLLEFDLLSKQPFLEWLIVEVGSKSISFNSLTLSKTSSSGSIIGTSS